MGNLRSKLTHAAKRRKLRCEALEDRRVFAGLNDLAPPVASPQAVGDSPFVAALYQDLLQRPADAGGMAFFSGLLATGTSPSDVVFMLWRSAEHFGLEVDSYYQNFLNRPSDAAGRQAWVNNLIAGMTEEQVQTAFLNSAEYQQYNPPVDLFVIGLYHDVLQRAPDFAGELFWNNQLGTFVTTPAQAIDAFMDSTESHNLWVSTFYLQFLGRQGDDAGINGWVQLLDQGAVNYQFVGQSFLSSAEYISDNPLA